MPKRNGPVAKPLDERIRANVVIDDNGCWRWQRSLKPNGYGQIGVPGLGMRYAHRVAYEAWRGPIPVGLQIDHLCRVRDCCNPDHLEAVTCRENIVRGTGFVAVHVAKTHCPTGHAYDERNTKIDRKGSRICRRCKVASLQRWRERRKEAVSNAA
jgi:hypothetical protein